MTFVLQNKCEKNAKQNKIAAPDYHTVEAQAVQLFY